MGCSVGTPDVAAPSTHHPRGGLIVVYATVVLDATVGDGALYTDAAFDLREETTNAVKPPRTVRVGPGAGAVGRTTVTLVETFGVGPQGGDLSFVLEGTSGGGRPVVALLPGMTAVFVPTFQTVQP